MIAGILVGGIIWAACVSLFFVYPNPWTFALALLVGPFLGGFTGGRLGGGRAAYVLIIVGIIAVLAVSVKYVPDTSWQYPHHVWAGIGLFIALLILGNLLFVGFGSLIGIQGALRSGLKRATPKTVVAGPAKGDFVRGTAPRMPNPLQSRIGELEKQEQDLQRDLTVLKDRKGLEQISPQLLREREKEIQTQLLDIVLEKERLLRKTQGNPA